MSEKGHSNGYRFLRRIRALFGKSQTWDTGKFMPASDCNFDYGRMQIPAAEVERILATAGRYEGMKKSAKPKTKANFRS